MGPFGGFVFHENTSSISQSLGQKKQNRFGHPQFYSSIAPMGLIDQKMRDNFQVFLERAQPTFLFYIVFFSKSFA